jgi:SET domain-containing protein
MLTVHNVKAESGFEVQPSKIDGNGVFATRFWLARRKLGEAEGVIVSKKEVERLTEQQDRLHLWEFDDGETLQFTNDLRFINHSCRPNAFCRVVGHRIEVYTLRNVEMGEEITVDYGPYTHHEGALRCRCGCEKHYL